MSRFYEKYPLVLGSLESKHAEKGYTRKKVICDNGRHAVRCMEWAPLAASPIHEHGGRPCFDIILEGSLEIIDLEPIRRGDGRFELKEIKKYSAETGGFVIVDPAGTGAETHKVINRERKSRSLHFYPIDHRKLGTYKKEPDGLYKHEISDVPDD